MITAILGIIFFIVSVYFIIPYFRGSEHFATGYFVDIKSRLPNIIKNGTSYFRLMISPLFYSLFSPLTLLTSLPEWAINILSINSNQRSIYFHYNSIIVAFLFYSLILGYKNFDRIIKSKILKVIIFLIFISINIYSIYQYNPIPYFVKQPVHYNEIDKIKSESIKFLVNKLKDENIKVATTPKLAPFFTNRRFYYNFLYDSAFASIGITEDRIIKNEINKYRLADYVIINKQEVKQKLSNKFYNKLKNDVDYQMIFFDNQEIEVFKKI